MIMKILLVSMSVAMAMVLCSCGKPDIRKTAVAPPLGEPALAHQPDSVLARNEGIAGDQAGQAVVLAREQAVDQELLAREAIQVELDRDAQVARAIEHARRQVLAQAYIERAVNSASQASPQEIRKFYEENPALFAKRRTYRVLELMVDLPPAQFGDLQEAVAKAQNLAGVVRWLKSRKIPFDTATPSAAAERIPVNTLRRLFEMRDGQIAVFQTPHGASVLRLEQSVEAPLSEKQASPAIARYLLNRKRLELAQAEVAKLRERAKTDDRGIKKRSRPATLAQTTAQARPLLEMPRMARITTGIAELR